jgi:hypothetical protein
LQGLGKTIVTLACILANPKPQLPLAEPAPPARIAGKHPTSATLVVCAVSLVGQWISEAKSKLSTNMRIHMCATPVTTPPRSVSPCPTPGMYAYRDARVWGYVAQVSRPGPHP